MRGDEGRKGVYFRRLLPLKDIRRLSSRPDVGVDRALLLSWTRH